MASEMSVYVCNTPAQVVTARQFLKNAGYSDTGISDHQVDAFIYDAVTYGGGGKSDNLRKKFVVIGRK